VLLSLAMVVKAKKLAAKKKKKQLAAAKRIQKNVRAMLKQKKKTQNLHRRNLNTSLVVCTNIKAASMDAALMF